jgi:hypothetical protein
MASVLSGRVMDQEQYSRWCIVFILSEFTGSPGDACSVTKFFEYF